MLQVAAPTSWFRTAKAIALAPLLLAAAALSSANAGARLLQIIHTNDLHSHLEHAEDHEVGGYAAVKAQIDILKAQSRAEGIDVLVLDAGDFTEGSPFFLADKGEQSWKMMNAMGYDAVALGNHDYLMGQVDLNRIVGNVRPRFPVLAANFDPDPRLANIRRHFRPFQEFQKSGLKIAVLGLTTDEFVYKWRVGDRSIGKPVLSAFDYAPELKGRNDLVIALTHLGERADQMLVRNVNGMDLVIGGHSHTSLHEPIRVKSPDGTVVPIVQAGKHGEVIGDLLVDVEPGRPLEILRYRLIPVHANGPHDPFVDHSIQIARRSLEAQYGHDWLHESLGVTEVPMLTPMQGPTVWGQIAADAMRDAGKADFSLDAGGLLFGDNVPGGAITREKIFQFYPRVFSFDHPLGWTVWTTRVRGWVLKVGITQAIGNGLLLNFSSNVTYDLVGSGSRKKVRNIRINGRKIRTFGMYTMATPEGIGRAIREMSIPFKLFFRKARDSGKPIWTAIEEQVRRLGVIKVGDALRLGRVAAIAP